MSNILLAYIMINVFSVLVWFMPVLKVMDEGKKAINYGHIICLILFPLGLIFTIVYVGICILLITIKEKIEPYLSRKLFK